MIVPSKAARGGLLSDTDFYTTLRRLALPVILQNLLISSLSFVDTLMIGQIGEVAIAAVGLANQMFFLVILLLFGIGSGSSIFFAQFWGSKDLPSIHKSMGIALLTGLTGASWMAAVSMIAPRFVMRLFSPDPLVVAAGADYLRIVGISYIFSSVTFIFSSALRSTENARLPLLVSTISLTTNAIFNYLLIFGKFGFPELGIQGAAIATAGSRCIEMVLIITISFKRRMPTAASLHEYFGFDRAFVKSFFRTTLPVILNEIVWSLGMVVYKVVYARMGTSVIASVNVSEAIQSLFFVVLMGTGNSAAVMCGKKIGEKQYHLLDTYAKRFLKLAVVIGSLLGVGMMLTASFAPRAFNVSPEIRIMTQRSLVMLGFVIPFKAFNIHSIVGILRSGGDTRFSLFLELTSVWCIGVPLAMIGGLVIGMPIHLLYLFVGIEELYKMIVGLIRIRSGRWVNDLTHIAHAGEPPQEPGIFPPSGTVTGEPMIDV